jgi:shikimate dehydrogenase
MTGAGKPYAEVIGDPISHSKSPLIHNFWLSKLGIEADYRACHVRAEELADYFAMRREDPDWRGCNVTIPHKLSVLDFADEQDSRVAHVGAANCLWPRSQGRLCATNTDVDGVAAAIGAARSGKAVVIGAGGAARSAFVWLAGRAGLETTVLARSPDKARRAAEECGLKTQFPAFALGSGVFEGASLVINATQLGMTGQEAMPTFVLDELTSLQPEALVFDMVYSPLETGLLARARALGLGTADGLVMLIGQAATAFEHFFGQPAPRQYDAELRDLLTR